MTCQHQTYWYENEVARVKFCDRPATMVTRALDGSRNRACDEHGSMMIQAGAERVDEANHQG